MPKYLMNRLIAIVNVTFPSGGHRYVIVLADSLTDAFNDVKLYLEAEFGLRDVVIGSPEKIVRVDVPSNPAPNPILWVSPEAGPNAPAG